LDGRKRRWWGSSLRRSGSRWQDRQDRAWRQRKPPLDALREGKVTFFISDNNNSGWIPILIRLGVEIKANENVAPWFYFDLGPGIAFGMGSGSGGSNASFAWRIGAGTAFWGVLGKNKNKSDSAATASSEPAEEPYEE
jgi:hypothetical protein